MRMQAKSSSLGSAVALGILFGVFLVLAQEAWIGYRIAARYRQAAVVPGLTQQIESIPGIHSENTPNLQTGEQVSVGDSVDSENRLEKKEHNFSEEAAFEQGLPPETGCPAYYRYSPEGHALIQTGHGEYRLDFVWLRENNPDFVGWLIFPDTDISYPVVQGSNNDYYLKHLFSGAYSDLGSIFVDYRSHLLEDEHTIVYGHNFHDYGVMFSQLVNYKDQGFYEANPVAYFLTESGGYTLEVFSAFEVEVTDSIYTFTFHAEEEYADWLKETQEKSAVQATVAPSAADKTMTFSTCSNTSRDGRFVVTCRIVPFEYPVIRRY